jgi:hypothetical protein
MLWNRRSWLCGDRKEWAPEPNGVTPQKAISLPCPIAAVPIRPPQWQTIGASFGFAKRYLEEIQVPGTKRMRRAGHISLSFHLAPTIAVRRRKNHDAAVGAVGSGVAPGSTGKVPRIAVGGQGPHADRSRTVIHLGLNLRLAEPWLAEPWLAEPWAG